MQLQTFRTIKVVQQQNLLVLK